MDKKNIREYELGLDLATVFVGPLKRWKKILVCGLVFAVLLSGFSYAKTTGVFGKETKEEKIKSYNKDVAQLEKEIEMLQREYESNEKYIDNSILMSLNNDNAYTGYAKFNISVNAEDENEQKLLLSKYRSVYERVLDSEETIEFIRNKIPNVDDVYLSELAKFVTTGSDGLITITFSYTDKKIVQDVIGFISDSFDKYYKNDTDSDEYTLDSLGTSVRKGVTTDLDKTYSSVIKQIADLGTQISDKKTQLESLKSPYFSVKSLIKYAVVGFVGGAILAYGVYFLVLVIGGRIESLNQVKITFGSSSVLSSFAEKDKPSGFMMKMLYKGLYTEKDEFLKAFENNYAAVSHGQYKNTVIISDDDTGLDGFTAIPGDTSAEALEKLSGADSVIIGIKIGKTKINDVIEEIQKIDFYEKDFLGFIVLV